MADRRVSFSGEESSHFSRFAHAALRSGVRLRAEVQGRDPLTARSVLVRGTLTDAVVDGYVRNITLTELGSGIAYAIGGSNATFEIAAKTIAFYVTESDFGRLLHYADTLDEFIPRVIPDNTPSGEIWRRLDSACAAPSQDSIEFVLDCLHNQEHAVAREAVMTLRALAGQINRRRHLQVRAEKELRDATHSPDLLTRIAAAEDLGYIGTVDSIPALSRLVQDVNEQESVRWAAAIALSRIPDDSAIAPLVAASATVEGGAALGTLLALSRRASEQIQDLLEPIFARFLVPSTAGSLKRYSCLGLSRFRKLSASSLAQLLDVFGDYSLEVDTRGFAALTLSSCLPSLDASTRARVERLVDSFAGTVSTESLHPETIWSLEFTAELATLLELNESAARFYRLLAGSFEDWRRLYYTALGLYEQGEASVRQGEIDEGLQMFYSAARQLESIRDADPDEALTIAFRRDVTRARLLVQEIIRDWLHSVEVESLAALADSMREVIGTYARYSGTMAESSSPKQLSLREAEYIRTTRRLMEIMRLLLLLDASLRSSHPDLDQMANEIDNLQEALGDVRSQYFARLPQVLRSLVGEAHSRFRALQVTLEQPQLGSLHKLRALRSLMSELRGLFRKATWPMPARACPVGGLGRGQIAVLQEDIRGDGTAEEPLELPKGGPFVLNILVHIEEMAPGASTRAVVVCRVGQREIVENIHVVEGPLRCSIVLPDVVPPVGSVKCSLSLLFEARDCHQLAVRKDVYLRTRA